MTKDRPASEPFPVTQRERDIVERNHRDTPRPTEADDLRADIAALERRNETLTNELIVAKRALASSPAPAGLDVDARRSLVDQYGERAVMDMEAALASSPAPAGPTPDDMADIMQAATGGPDFTVKDWPPAPAGLSITDDPDYYPSTEYERGYADGRAASSPAPAGLEPDVEKVRAEYQRFYAFVADSDPALVDAWHFTENARAATRPADLLDTTYHARRKARRRG